MYPSEQRKALHEQVEQVHDRDIDHLVRLMRAFLHPSEPDTSHRITFRRIPPGSKAAAEIEQQRQQALAALKARQSEIITRSVGDGIKRLRIDLNKVVGGSSSWSGSGDAAGELTCNWLEEGVFNRLGMFHLENQRILTLERCHVAGRDAELVYNLRVLTQLTDLERELTVPL